MRLLRNSRGKPHPMRVVGRSNGPPFWTRPVGIVAPRGSAVAVGAGMMRMMLWGCRRRWRRPKRGCSSRRTSQQAAVAEARRWTMLLHPPKRFFRRTLGRSRARPLATTPSPSSFQHDDDGGAAGQVQATKTKKDCATWCFSPLFFMMFFLRRTFWTIGGAMRSAVSRMICTNKLGPISKKISKKLCAMGIRGR